MWIGIGISAVALLICLLMVVRREPNAYRRIIPTGAAPGSEAAPILVSPFGRDRLRLSTRRAVIATVVSAGLAAALITPVAGAIVLALTLVGLLVPRGRTLLRVGSVAALVVSAGYVIEVQARYDLPETGQWVQAFHRVATISWLAAALLVADVLVGWARRDVAGLEAAAVEGPVLEGAVVEASETPAAPEGSATPITVNLEKPEKPPTG